MTPHLAEQAYQRTAKSERDTLIVAHLRLVRHVLRRCVGELPEGVDLENLEAAGVLGLVEAAQHFDPARGVPFGVFARKRIQGAVWDELRRNSPLPQQMLARIATIRRYLEQTPPPVSPEQLSDALGMSREEIGQALDAMRISRMRSWEDRETRPWDLISPHAETPLDESERKELLQAMTQAITELPEQERIVLNLYHHEDLRLREIAAAMRLSESRISRVLASAEFRLGQRLRAGWHRSRSKPE